MPEYDPNTLRRLQLTQLEIYKSFAAFCEKHALCQTVVDGTLLGAVRHQGFIPWDDDIDVAMPRSDYERFMCLLPELDDRYEVLSVQNTAGYVLPFAKMCLKGTTFVEATDVDRTYHSGIFIDIFPFDETSADLDTRLKQTRQTFLLARLMVLTEYKYPKLPAGITGLIQRIMHAGTAVVYYLLKLFKVSKIKVYKAYLKHATKHAGGGWYMNITQYRAGDTMHPKETLYPPVTLFFERTEVFVFRDHHTYLKGFYGADYMTPPSIEDRHNHVASVLDFGD